MFLELFVRVVVLLWFVVEVGECILVFYVQDFDVFEKVDGFLVIVVDVVVEVVIQVGFLRICFMVIVVVEEVVEVGRLLFGVFWYFFVDFFDGMKEFVKKNGEFIVNIVLIENGRLVFGVVYVLVLGDFYWGGGLLVDLDLLGVVVD